MKRNRSIPFGYTYRNGIRVVDEQEATAIRKIFQAYQQGASLSEIAAMMTRQKVPYSEKQLLWNKNMVDRILSNPRYTGEAGYQPIVDTATYQSVMSHKAARSTTSASGDTVVDLLRSKVVCGTCGAKMLRTQGRTPTSSAYWKCSCPDCQKKVSIKDAALSLGIQDRMNQIIQHPSRLEDADAYRLDIDSPTQKSKITDELSRMCESKNYSDEQLLEFILAAARSTYECCPEQSAGAASAVVLAYSEACEQDELDVALFEKTVDKVLLNTDSSVRLRLITGKEI